MTKNELLVTKILNLMKYRRRLQFLEKLLRENSWMMVENKVGGGVVVSLSNAESAAGTTISDAIDKLIEKGSASVA